MYYNNKMVPHIGTRPVSPGFVAGSVIPTASMVAPVVTAAPALVTSTVAPAMAMVAPAVTTTQVVTEAPPVGKLDCYPRRFSLRIHSISEVCHGLRNP
jgi:hypothetical protein